MGILSNLVNMMDQNELEQARDLINARLFDLIRRSEAGEGFWLTQVPDDIADRISLIKIVRFHQTLPLKEAKDLVEAIAAGKPQRFIPATREAIVHRFPYLVWK